jgi:S1-C subfamily serine protease
MASVVIERIEGSACPQVLRLHVRSEVPDFDDPWERTTHEDVAVAAVVGPRWLLTLASVVLDAVDWIEPLGEHQARAKVIRVDHDRDLALLELADSITTVWGIQPFELGELPATGDVVLLAGEERSGHGVIAEIDLVRYWHSQRHLLAATIDARQPFNTGGDVAMRAGKLVGLVMQRHTDDELRGDLIPPAIIQGFLAGAAAGLPVGVPALGITFQAIANPAMRRQLGLGEDDGGILVTRIDHGGTCDGALEPRDILVSIDEHLIDADGNVTYGGRALRHYAALCTRHLGERCRLGVVRGGIRRTIEVTLGPLVSLVPRVRDSSPPPYFVIAGLVLQPLTRDFLCTWESWWNSGPKEFLHAYYSGQRTAERHELVALTQILEDPINVGYREYHNESILRVNGRVPRDLAEVIATVDAARGFITFEMSMGGLIVLDADEARAATPRILADNGIPRDRAT